MDIRSFGLLAAAAFSLAASNAAFANGGAYANGGSSGGGAYENGNSSSNGGANHQDAHTKGGAYHNGDTGKNGGAYGKKGAHGQNGAYANNGTYGNGGAHGGGKHSDGGAYGSNGAYAHGGAHGKGGAHGGGAYGNNGVVASNGDANGKGGAYSHGAYSNGDDPHSVRTSGASHLALLAGGNEVSTEGKANAGDQDGRGSATVKVDPAAGKLCFAVIVDGIDTPVAAHVHHGGAGQNGPVVVTITAPDSGDPGTASGCVSNLDAWLLKSIKEKPWAYYVNVHTSLYPNGAVRGQLF